MNPRVYNQTSLIFRYFMFLSDPGVPGVRSMGLDVTPTPCADLTDGTLFDEGNRAIGQ